MGVNIYHDEEKEGKDEISVDIPSEVTKTLGANNR